MEERNESSCGKNRDCSKNIWINSQFLALKLCIFLLYYFHYFQKSMARFPLLFFGTFMLFKKHFSSVGQDMELLKFFFLSDLFFGIFNNNSIIFFLLLILRLKYVFHVNCNSKRNKMINQVLWFSPTQKMPQWFFMIAKFLWFFFFIFTLACGFPFDSGVS